MADIFRPNDRADPGLTSSVSPLRITAAPLPMSEQFAFWRSAMEQVIETWLDDDERGGFPAEQTVWNLGKMAFAVAEMPSGRVRRWRHFAGNALDHWCLVLVLPGDRASAEPLLQLRSLAHPFEASASGQDTVISLYVPRDLFRDNAGQLDLLHKRPIEGPLAALLTDHLLSLRLRLPLISAADLPAVAEATRQLLWACLIPRRDTQDVGAPTLDNALMARAGRIVRENLAASEFGPAELGRSLGMSRSRLYRHFEPMGGVTHYIRAQRLVAARLALLDGADQRTIAEIGESVGFSDPSSFSRAFRHAFGHRPSDARSPHDHRTPTPGANKHAAGFADLSLAGILASLES